MLTRNESLCCSSLHSKGHLSRSSLNYIRNQPLNPSTSSAPPLGVHNEQSLPSIWGLHILGQFFWASCDVMMDMHVWQMSRFTLSTLGGGGNWAARLMARTNAASTNATSSRGLFSRPACHCNKQAS